IFEERRDALLVELLSFFMVVSFSCFDKFLADHLSILAALAVERAVGHPSYVVRASEHVVSKRIGIGPSRPAEGVDVVVALFACVVRIEERPPFESLDGSVEPSSFETSGNGNTNLFTLVVRRDDYLPRII